MRFGRGSQLHEFVERRLIEIVVFREIDLVRSPQVSPLLVTVDELDGWILDQFESARSGRGVASSTLHNEMDTLQAFIEYLERIEAVGDGLAEKVRVPDVPDDEKSRETKLDTERAIQLLQHYRNSDRYGSTYHALLEITWHTGARIGGIRALDLRNFDAGEQTLEFVHRPETDTPLKNKRNGERIVGIREAVTQAISTYIRWTRDDRHDEYGRQPLFSSLQGRPTTKHPSELDVSSDVPVCSPGVPARTLPADMRLHQPQQFEPVSVVASSAPCSDRLDHLASRLRGPARGDSRARECQPGRD